MSTKIQHVTYHQIDPEKWNRLILEAPNGLFYALSWFLDSVIHDWEALIEGDYEAAMVLPVFKRMGIPFIGQPYPAIQLGVFSKKKLTPEKINAFLDAIPSSYQIVRLYLNKFNLVKHNNWKSYTARCYELDLILQPEKLIQKFSKRIQENFGEARKKDFSLIKNLAPNDFIRLWKETDSPGSRAGLNLEQAIRKILARGLHHRMINIVGIYSRYNNLIASVVFSHFKQKTTPFLVALDQKDYGTLPLIWLIYKFILENGGKNKTLRFDPHSELKKPFLSGKVYNMGAPVPGIWDRIAPELGCQLNHFQILERINKSLLTTLTRPFFIGKKLPASLLKV